MVPRSWASTTSAVTSGGGLGDAELRKMRAGGVNVVATYVHLDPARGDPRGVSAGTETATCGGSSETRRPASASKVDRSASARGRTARRATAASRTGVQAPARGAPHERPRLPRARARRGTRRSPSRSRGLVHTAETPADRSSASRSTTSSTTSPSTWRRSATSPRRRGMRAPLWVATGLGRRAAAPDRLLPVYAGVLGRLLGGSR